MIGDGDPVSEVLHKIRTSMNTINGMTIVAREHISRGGDPNDCLRRVKMCLDVMAPESDRLARLIDDIDRLKSDLHSVETVSPETRPIDDDSLLKGLSVLIVDDVPGNSEVVAQMIDLSGGHSHVVDNGDAAVRFFAESGTGAVDCVLMDLVMPGKDGFAAAREIRSLDRDDAKTVPIIAMSADSFQGSIDKAKECGMNGYIIKPIRFKLLTEALKTHCHI